MALITVLVQASGNRRPNCLRAQALAVGLLGLDLEELEATAQRVGSQSCVLQANVSERLRMESAVSQLIDRFGRLDVVVANAGINWRVGFARVALAGRMESNDCSQPDRRIFDIEVCVPHLRETKGNAIINASINGTRCVQQLWGNGLACSKAAK